MNRKIIAFVLAFGLYVSAAPVVRVITLYQGSSAMIYSNSISRLNWIIENPDDTDARVTLLVKNAGGRANAIFSDEVLIPAKSVANGFSFVRGGDTGSCTVECIYNGRVIEKNDLLVNIKGRQYFPVAILNDTMSKGGYSDIQKSEKLPYKPLFTTYRSDNVPEYWSALEHYAAIVVLDADWQAYSALQFNALMDYVAMGGVLIAASPNAALKMRGTPLEQMLPYMPVNEEQDEKFDRLAGVFGVKTTADVEEYDENGFHQEQPCGSLLNFFPLEGAEPILSAKGRVYAMRANWGMGLVIGLAFDPFELVRRDREYILPVWSFIMGNSGYVPQFMLTDDTSRVNPMLQMLHGYSIPPVSSVLLILAVYAAVLVIVLAVFIKLRRQAAGWITVCVWALGAIVFILCKSSGTADNAAEFSAANVSVSPWNNSRGASVNNTLLLARKDMKPVVCGSDWDVILHPQVPKTVMVRHRGNMPSSQLWIHGSKERSSLEKMSLQKLRPRAIVWTDSGNGYTQYKCEMPSMKIMPEGIRIDDWKIPPELANADYAVLIVNGHTRKLELRDGILHDSGEKTLVEADTVLTAAMEYLKVLPVKSPMIVFITSNPEGKPLGLNMTASGRSASVYDLDMRVVPVFRGERNIPDVVPPELLSMQIPVGSLMRTMYKDGEWLPVGALTLRGGEYTVMFNVPSGYALESPAAVKVWFDAFNPSMNVTCVPQLIDADGRNIDGVLTGSGEYMFRTEGRRVVSRYGSCIMLKLNIKSDGAYTGAIAGVGRTDYWQVRSISASILNKL